MPDLDAFYSESQRKLQRRHQTEDLANTLFGAAVSGELSEQQSAFIESREFFFLSTVNGNGEPTVSYKGGAAGFVKVENANRLVFPSYDGNGMFLSLGNIAEAGKIGMLFIDFETPNRLRVQGTARIADREPDESEFPGAQLLIEVDVQSVFVNCARYIHKHSRAETSPYTPTESGDQPIPSWKRIDGFQSSLPENDRVRVATEGGTISAEDYGEKLRNGNS
ncbi:MAG: pyridoxamine 5'-phosphate oxidase family protein [Pseudomonadota bacterium]